jgi:di/tricarboxylate transporter
VALAAAGLMGLIFLSLSLRLDIIKKPENENLRHIAWQTFLNFFFLIMFALVFLVPEQSEPGTAIPLLIICTMAIGITISRAIRSTRARTSLFDVCKESLPSLLAYCGLVIIAIFILRGFIQSLIWMLPVVIVLLAVAIRNAWELLVAVRK